MRFNFAFPRPVGAALVLLGVAALGTGTVASELMTRAALVDERDAKLAFVARSLAAGRPRPAERGNGAADADLALVAESGTLAAARIDALVRSTLAAAGGTVLSSRSESKAEDPVGERNRRIEVEVEAQGRIEALQTSLFNLESGRPLVMIDALGLRPAEVSDGTRTDAQSPVLAATLTLSAFWTPPSPGPSAGQR